MAAEGRKEGNCDFSNVVAFGHNELWLPKGAKVATMLVEILANCMQYCHPAKLLPRIVAQVAHPS